MNLSRTRTRRRRAAVAPCRRGACRSSCGAAAGRVPRRVGAGRRSSSRCGAATSATASAATALRVVLQRRATGSTLLEHTLPDGDVDVSRSRDDLPGREPHAARGVRSGRHRRPTPTTSGPWLWQASWPIDQFPLRRDFEALAEVAAGPGGLRVRPRRRRRRARDPGRARCTPASSSPATSASRSSARRCCGSRSAWASCTRASRSASRR